MNQGVSIIAEMKKVEDAINTCYERVYQLEAKINSRNLTQARKDHIKQELEEVQKLLATNKTILKQMRKSNRGTFMVAVAIGLAIFIVWMLVEVFK